jgi:hypothetical protein
MGRNPESESAKLREETNRQSMGCWNHKDTVDYAFWKIRCQKQHGDTPAKALEKRHQIVAARITNLYKYKESLDSYDSRIFNRTVDDLLKDPTYMLEQWITTNKRAVVDGM